MLRWTVLLGTAALILGVGMPTEAQAQRSFGVSGGLSFPFGEIGEEFDTGFHLTGLAEAPLGALPLSLRGEVGFQRFTQGDDSLTHLSGLLNALFPVGDSAYLIGGLGIYNSAEKADHGNHSHDDAHNLFGLNGGLGFHLPLGGVRLIVESRFHNVFDDEHGGQRFIPLSIGFRF